jgi:two-component system KDP operon response regulator KdpE
VRSTGSSAARVLVVDGDVAARRHLVACMASQGYLVEEAGSSEEAIVRAGQHAPDLVLLELSLPGVDGHGAIARIRAFSDVPIVVVSSRDALAEKVAALDGGADDYVLKPFEAEELGARVRAALRRRPEAPEAPVVHVGDVAIDRVRQRVTREGADVHLTPTEQRFLDVLLRSDGRLVTYAQLVRELPPARGGEMDQQSLRVLVGQLRRKLGDDAGEPRMIATQFGIGYRWIAGESSSVAR